jgi:hypothetical protein
MILRSTIVALCAVTALPPAMLRAQAAGAQVPDPSSLVLVDGVVATVNDTVILQSELIAQVTGRIRTFEAQSGTKVTDAQREAFLQEARRQLIWRAAMAQGAKTLGIVPSQRVDEIVQDMMREDERQQQRDFGSLMRWSEAWAQQNLTYDSYEREQRTAKMYELTKQIAVNARLQNQFNLFITPRMMREAWRQRQPSLASTVAIVGVVGFGSRDDKTRALVAEAARVWRAEQLTPNELAARFRDRVAAIPMTVRVASSNRPKELQPELIDFGLAGPLGNVSEPFAAETSFQIWKVLDYAGGQQKSFDDPETQVQLRRMLEGQVVDKLQDDALRRCLERTQPWVPSLDRIGMQAPPAPATPDKAPDKSAQQPAH